MPKIYHRFACGPSRRYWLRAVAYLTACAFASWAHAATVAAEFNLDDLPHYRPEKMVSGTIRNFGFSLHGLLQLWERDFSKFQPNIHFADKFPSSDAGIAGLVCDVADLGVQAREPTLIEHLMFYEAKGFALSSVTVASGGYDIEGMADGIVIFVNKANPLSKLTLRQLDGIFGAERTGTLVGFHWTLQNARGPADDIRTWGQLGLTGKWAKQAINTYGYAPTGMSNYFQLRVLGGSDKWNPNYREYVESGTKMIAADDTTMRGGLHYMLANELARDRYGIAWGVMPQARGIAGLKTIALSLGDSGPYVAPSKKSFQDRSYPLSRNIYLYFSRAPGKPIDPKIREFMRFVLSREGQQAVNRSGLYLPLPAAVLGEQLGKLKD